MTRTEFMKAFDRTELDPKSFDHAAHVRAAWTALQQGTLLSSMTRLRRGLRSLAASVGEEQSYHETITCALLLLIHDRQAAEPCDSWSEFAERNPDLMRWNGGALLAPYYEKSTLDSELARRSFIPPEVRAESMPAPNAAAQGVSA